MKDKPGDKQRLLHIIDAITEIENYTTNVTPPDFIASSMMRLHQLNKLKLLVKLHTLFPQRPNQNFHK